MMPMRSMKRYVRPMKYARVSLAMVPAATASPSDWRAGFFSAPICSSRENSSGASAAIDWNLGCLCAEGTGFAVQQQGMGT